jgi:hypothetical protein
VTGITKKFTALKEVNFMEEENRTKRDCFFFDTNLLLEEKKC